MISRRNFLGGLIAAPAVVKIGSLMPIKGIIMDFQPPFDYHYFHQQVSLGYTITREAINRNLYERGTGNSPWDRIYDADIKTRLSGFASSPVD